MTDPRCGPTAAEGPDREALNLRAVADACESFLRVWRDHHAQPSAFGAPVAALVALLPPSPAPGDGDRATLAPLTGAAVMGEKHQVQAGAGRPWPGDRDTGRDE